MLYIHETCRQHLKVGLKQQSACQLCPMLLWELESFNAMIMRWRDWSDAAVAWLGVIMTDHGGTVWGKSDLWITEQGFNRLSDESFAAIIENAERCQQEEPGLQVLQQS
jgi:hypothetical protein